MTWQRYPRPIYTDPTQIDADIRNGTFARKTRAHAEAVEAWYAQVRPPLGRATADAEAPSTSAVVWAASPANVNGDQPPDRSPFASPSTEDRCARF